MKKLYILIASVLITVSGLAQAPEGFNYQSVVRDNAGEVIANTGISIQFQLHETTAVGPVIYTETHSVTTNANGLFTTIVGQGTTSDLFNTINWASDSFFLETAVDIAGGSTYLSMGTSQLLSVPYALYAKTSGSGNYKGTSNESLTWTDLQTDCNLGTTYQICYDTSIATLTTNETLSFTPGMRILVTSATDSNVYFVGTVQTYLGNEMTILIEYITDATGALNNWVLNLGNGAVGIPGAMGEMGPSRDCRSFASGQGGITIGTNSNSSIISTYSGYAYNNVNIDLLIDVGIGSFIIEVYESDSNAIDLSNANLIGTYSGSSTGGLTYVTLNAMPLYSSSILQFRRGAASVSYEVIEICVNN